MTHNKTAHILSSQVKLKSKIFSVAEQQIELPDGKHITRMVVEHPGAVIILPVTKNNTLLLVNQYRAAIGQNLLEFPAGTLEVGEAPLACAQRELQEEVGRSAREWVSLGTIFPAPGFCSEKQFAFFAKDLGETAQAFDEDEIIEVVEMSIEEIDVAVKEGTLIDGKSLALLTLARTKGLL